MATVEQRHRDKALDILSSDGTGAGWQQEIAQALADAEEEGYDRGFEVAQETIGEWHKPL